MISCPIWFTKDLPSDIRLDGELWMGRGKFEDIMALLNSSTNYSEKRWNHVKYIVFDIPVSNLPYELRMDQLQKLKLPSHTIGIQIHPCLGNEHLLKLLLEITAYGGEGLMLMKPQSFYSPGKRSNILLKVKVYLSWLFGALFERSTKNLRLNCWKYYQMGSTVNSKYPIMNTHTCRISGKESLVGYSLFDLLPPIGSIITIKHSGMFQNGTLRNAFYWRHRSDILWEPVLSNKSLVT